MDWVIPVREREPAAELRYALRSLHQNAPHARVWLVGYRPSWVTLDRRSGLRHIPTRQTGTKYTNSTLAMRTACEHPGVSDPFIWSNDDIFVMRRISAVEVFHRGPVAQVEAYYQARASGRYLAGMRATRDLLVRMGHRDPLSYELHVPLPVRKGPMLEALRAAADIDVVHKRTLYGVTAGIGGRRLRDVKVTHPGPGFGPPGDYLSTMPASWHGAAGRLIRARFPRPSPWEDPDAPAPGGGPPLEFPAPRRRGCAR